MSELTDLLRMQWANPDLTSPQMQLMDDAADALDAAEAKLAQVIEGNTAVVDMLEAAEAKLAHLEGDLIPNLRVELGMANAYIEDLTAKLAAIDALHFRVPYPAPSGDFCHEDGLTWPCPTRRVIHPEDGAL